MARIWTAIMVTALGMQIAPALAATAPQTVSVPAEAEMPLTGAFASALTRYRNCVLTNVDGQPLAEKDQMVSDAMASCAIVRGEVQHQLAEDIRASNATSTEAASNQAEGAMSGIDPMIEAAAAERASVAYARVMI